MGIDPLIVLDTHAWVWWVSGSSRLSSRARAEVEQAASERVLRASSISAWEVAQLVERGRLELTMDVEDWIARAESLSTIDFVPVDNRIAVRSTRLPGALHRDPVDRIIVATALTLGAALVTRDERLQRYRHVRTVW